MGGRAAWEAHERALVACRRCPRLVAWREQVARERRRAYREWDYWGRPVPGFGDHAARVLAVGLAPGAHGSNRTGRMFTGDASGDFLYPALHRAGFATQPSSTSREDGLALTDLFITALCRCVPPANKPTPREIANCRPFLATELGLLPHVRVIVALGRLAFEEVWRIHPHDGGRLAHFAFAHGAHARIGEGLPWLIASYHPSRQNTNTGRLTARMFDRIWTLARKLAEADV
ncbi:MAG: uracil-DNA glycosylase [Chloroflexi bacterium]|nr:uracil-DNA glycosylase [Chloroflexota bacterium]